MTERTWQLKAMSVAELLDETIRLYRHNFLTFVGIVALLQLPFTLLLNVLQAVVIQQQLVLMEGNLGNDPSTTLTTGYIVVIILLLVLAVINFLVINNLVTAALAQAISNRYMGEPVSIGGAYRSILKRFWPLVGALLLLVLLNAALMIPLVLGAFIPCLGIVLFFLVFGVFALINLRLIFVTQAVVLEAKSARESLRRSWDLIKGYGWRTLGIYLLLYLFSLLLVSGPSYVVTYGLQALDLAIMVQMIVSGVTTVVLTVLYRPIQLTGMTLLYYDLRIRKEGLDLELQAEALESDVVLEPLFLSETDQREIEL